MQVVMITVKPIIQQITKIMQDTMKPKSIKKILESLKIITTT